MPKFPWAESVGFTYPGSQARSGEARPSCFVSRTVGDESDAAQTLRGSHSTGAGLPPDLTWGCCGPPAIWALTFLHQPGLVATESRLKPVSDFFLIERPGVTGFRPLLLSPGDCTGGRERSSLPCSRQPPGGLPGSQVTLRWPLFCWVGRPRCPSTSPWSSNVKIVFHFRLTQGYNF